MAREISAAVREGRKAENIERVQVVLRSLDLVFVRDVTNLVDWMDGENGVGRADRVVQFCAVMDSWPLLTESDCWAVGLFVRVLADLRAREFAAGDTEPFISAE